MRGGSESIRRALKAFLQFVVVALEILRSSFLCKCGQRRLRRHSSIGNTRILLGRGHDELPQIYAGRGHRTTELFCSVRG